MSCVASSGRSLRAWHRAAALAAGIFVMAAPSGALAAVSVESEAGVAITLSAVTAASPGDTWHTLIAPARWWLPEHTYSGAARNLALDARAAGCFCETLPARAGAPTGQQPGTVEHMRVVYADPARGTLRLTGALGPLQAEAVSGTLTIQLKPEGQGTRIEWTYVFGGYMRFKLSPMAQAVDRVLGQQLASLAARSAQGNPGGASR